ncbi:tRNA (adenine(22)-N(1))-methyltransferase [Cytobacillus gottheilii]|uniref:tRNA (Adenine-N(1))-methyltransferase n=1 Tax=Cytobacillus gottheilii TaxID=859144 RepID=A0ABX8FA78_9BACI|nr:tRNA (adenine(22)-N(1))-methyltransferase TrmK [Cytobacillus gottheilii]QVY60371.1 tRNA (adenine-N(1))-methyltransferase [Cytobacillus gottheilii]
MNTDKLSKRLESVANYIIEDSAIADIGSDHAYLPCYAVKTGLAKRAVAGEVVEGPFQSAKKQVQNEGLGDRIAVRKGSGLEVIEAGEVDCITIAGMGGPLIASILEDGKDKLTGKERLVLQPNISAIAIREWLLKNGWKLIAEEILEEDGKIYEILVAEKGDPEAPYHHLEKELLFGPFLMNEKSPAFMKKWEGELANWRKILVNLEKASGSEENEEKKQALQKKIHYTEEVIQQ